MPAGASSCAYCLHRLSCSRSIPLLQQFGDFVVLERIEVGKQVPFKFFGRSVQVVVFGARDHMEQDMVFLEIILALEWAVALADIGTLAKFADDTLLHKKDEFENILQFLWRQFPRLFNVPPRDHQRMPRHFPWIAEYDYGTIVLLDDAVFGVTKWAGCLCHMPIVYLVPA